jgi:TolB-like protein
MSLPFHGVWKNRVAGRGFYLLLILLLSIFLQSGSVHAAGSSTDFRKIKVAVLDFQQNGVFETNDIGKIVAEWFTTALVESGRFEIIERRLLQQILEEQKIGASGLIDPRSASQLGRILGVKTVVSGTVQNYDRTYELNTRLIDVETGSIIVAESVKAGSTSSLNALVNQVADKIIRYFPLQGYVVQRAGDKGVIDLGRKAGIRPGMVFKVFVEGAPLKHPMTGEILSVERVEKGTIRVREVMDKTSVGVIEKENCKKCIKAGQLVSSVLAEDELPPEAPLEPLPVPAVPVTPPAVPPQSVETATLPAHVFKLLSGHRDEIRAVAVAANGSFAATADEGGVISLWDLKTWRLVDTFKNSKGHLNAVAFSPDAKLLAAGGDDKEVIVWRLIDRKPAYSFKIRDEITSIVFAGDLLLAVGTDSKRVFVWNYKRDSNPLRISTDKDVLALAASPDGKQIATAGNDDKVTIWDSQKGEKLRVLKGHSDDVRALVYSSGGKWLISGGDDKKIIVWDPFGGRQLHTFAGHRDNIMFLAMSSDGRRLVSGESKRSDGALVLWEPASGKELKRFVIPKKVTALAISPNGRYLFGAVDKDLQVFSLE